MACRPPKSLNSPAIIQSYFVLWLTFFMCIPFSPPLCLPSASEDTYLLGGNWPGRGRMARFIANAGQTYVLTTSQSFKRCVLSYT